MAAPDRVCACRPFARALAQHAPVRACRTAAHALAGVVGGALAGGAADLAGRRAAGACAADTQRRRALRAAPGAAARPRHALAPVGRAAGKLRRRGGGGAAAVLAGGSRGPALLARDLSRGAAHWRRDRLAARRGDALAELRGKPRHSGDSGRCAARLYRAAGTAPRFGCLLA